jgi:hypothetical protein
MEIARILKRQEGLGLIITGSHSCLQSKCILLSNSGFWHDSLELFMSTYQKPKKSISEGKLKHLVSSFFKVEAINLRPNSQPPQKITRFQTYKTRKMTKKASIWNSILQTTSKKA